MSTPAATPHHALGRGRPRLTWQRIALGFAGVGFGVLAPYVATHPDLGRGLIGAQLLWILLTAASVTLLVIATDRPWRGPHHVARRARGAGAGATGTPAMTAARAVPTFELGRVGKAGLGMLLLLTAGLLVAFVRGGAIAFVWVGCLVGGLVLFLTALFPDGPLRRRHHDAPPGRHRAE